MMSLIFKSRYHRCVELDFRSKVKALDSAPVMKALLISKSNIRGKSAHQICTFMRYTCMILNEPK